MVRGILLQHVQLYPTHSPLVVRGAAIALPLNAEGVTKADAAPRSTTRRNAKSFILERSIGIAIEYATGISEFDEGIRGATKEQNAGQLQEGRIVAGNSGQPR